MPFSKGLFVKDGCGDFAASDAMGLEATAQAAGDALDPC